MTKCYLPKSDFELKLDRYRRRGEEKPREVIEKFGPLILESTVEIPSSEDTYDLDDYFPSFKESPKEERSTPPSKPSSLLGEIFWGIVGFFFIIGFLIYIWLEDKF